MPIKTDFGPTGEGISLPATEPKTRSRTAKKAAARAARQAITVEALDVPDTYTVGPRRYDAHSALRDLVWARHLAFKTNTQIATDLGISYKQVVTLLAEQRDMIRDENAELAPYDRALYSARLEALLAAAWPQAVGGPQLDEEGDVRLNKSGEAIQFPPDVKFVTAAHKLLETLIDLKGLKAPERVELSAAIAHEHTIDVTQLTPEQVALYELARRGLIPASPAKGAIGAVLDADVTPVTETELDAGEETRDPASNGPESGPTEPAAEPDAPTSYLEPEGEIAVEAVRKASEIHNPYAGTADARVVDDAGRVWERGPDGQPVKGRRGRRA